ncbi:MAG: sigma-70 family RNA polymerase sigma factor [Proteobacteria bacterium]|nr:MAG: sigma-70 family RNA polymerase sigma factor [Pseudomonadota bacterium]
MNSPVTADLDFETLYRRHFHAVRAVVSRFRFADAAQDDLIQDIFIQAWKNLSSLKEPAAFSGWLMTIARNRCLSELKKTKKNISIAMTDSVGDREDGGPAEIVLVAEDDYASLHFEHSTILLNQLIQLHEGEPRATVAKLFYLEEKSVKEICDALSMNQNTVLSHLRRFRLIVSQAMLRLVEEKGIEIR